MSSAAILEEPVHSSVAIRAAHVHKRFVEKRKSPIDALRGVSVEVSRSEIVGLVGPDGAGKTTLMRCVAGLLVPTAGEIRVLGLDAARDTIAVRGRIGYMPQKFGLYQDLTVQENLDLYADLRGVPMAERADRYARLMKMTKLGGFTGRLAARLSGGMKQKLGLACALIKSPELLLLDEPTVGVDPVSRHELWQIVNELVQVDRIGVLVSTAYLDEAERCDRIIVMFDGQVVDAGTPEEFRKRLQGQVFEVHCDSQRSARRVHSHAVTLPQIADATIRSGGVRIVQHDRSDARSVRQLGTQLRARIEPTAPVFEDAFMHIAYTRRPNGNDKDVVQATDAVMPSSTMDHGQPVVHVSDLVKRFGAFEAVKHVSFDAHAREVFGLLGPNGAGKTTTFRMLCGLLSVSEGEVRVAGHDLRRAAGRARARLGYMAQQFSLYGKLSVRENLEFFGRTYGLAGPRLRERLQWACDSFGLGTWRDSTAATLPGGYKQRLAMAVATLHEPEILFLDEPTSGVDPLARREFWQRINVFTESGVTVIVTTHFMEEAEYCDRMLILVQGKPLALGTPAEIRAMATDSENPNPSIEDAFISLAEGRIESKQVAPLQTEDYA